MQHVSVLQSAWPCISRLFQQQPQRQAAQSGVVRLRRFPLLRYRGHSRPRWENAVFEINQQTDVNFSWTDSTSPSWKAYAADYGATGWEGQSQWNVVLGSTRSASSKLNTRYLSTGMPFDRLKVVWLHELCHVWGLGHVSGINHVMYQSASDAYLRGGVRTLTSDEKNGINNLY